jgi:hypothetical protein
MNEQEQNLIEVFDEKYNELSDEEKKKFHKHFDNDKFPDLKKDLEKLIFKKKPPTGEEFLDPKNGWIPPKLNIWKHVRKDFINIVDNKNINYNKIAMYGSTRLGKTVMARLLILYTIVFIHHLRDPGAYYGVDSYTTLAIYLISFKFPKTRQLYLKHIYKYMEEAPNYERILLKDKVVKEQAKYGVSKIVWSSAALVGEITLASGLQILLGNDNPNEQIGSDLIQVYVSEISFFIEEAGTTEDEIFTLYTNSVSRINATVGHKYLTYVYLDSSANMADSKIEQHIINDLQYDTNTYFTWRNQWETQKGKVAPIWWEARTRALKKNPDISIDTLNEQLYQKDIMFKVITGSGDITAKIVKDGRELKDIPNDLIQYIPIDLKPQYELNLIKSIKDIGGKPTNKESKFIPNSKDILNIFTNLNLKNIEGGIIADSSLEPKKLIWDQVKDKFFVKRNLERYQFYRCPSEPRYIGLDVSTANKGDPYGFTMLHKEYSEKLKSPIYVVDISCVILPEKNGININAVEDFILDMMIEGSIIINSVSADTYYQKTFKQKLEDRNGIKTIAQSVDTSLHPYQYLYSALLQKKLKSGKNIFLKNNLSCLERVTIKGNEQIDHPEGKINHAYLGDFDNSTCGLNEKDCSDSLVQALWSASQNKLMPATIYEEEELRFSTKKEDIEATIRKNYKKLTNFHI